MAWTIGRAGSPMVSISRGTACAHGSPALARATTSAKAVRSSGGPRCATSAIAWREARPAEPATTRRSTASGRRAQRTACRARPARCVLTRAKTGTDTATRPAPTGPIVISPTMAAAAVSTATRRRPDNPDGRRRSGRSPTPSPDVVMSGRCRSSASRAAGLRSAPRTTTSTTHTATSRVAGQVTVPPPRWSGASTAGPSPAVPRRRPDRRHRAACRSGTRGRPDRPARTGP